MSKLFKLKVLTCNRVILIFPIFVTYRNYAVFQCILYIGMMKLFAKRNLRIFELHI